MKALAINGSPRKGGNVEILLRRALEPIFAAGHETEIVQIGGARLRGCTACGDCGRNLNKRCVLEDDGFNEVFAKMLEADAILIGTPAYFADMTADVRAATPSHAAQLLWPDRMELHRQWQTRTRALELAGARFQERFTERLNGFERTLAWASPARRLSGWEDRLAAAKRLLESAGRLMLKRAETRFETCAGMLAGAPKRLPGQEERRAELERRLAASKMFGITRKEALLGSLAGQVARVPERLPARRHALETLRLHLENSGERLLNRAETGLERCLLRLEAVNPHAPLERGYALARKQDGAFVRMTRDVAPGESLQLVVSNGEIPVRVEGENA